MRNGLADFHVRDNAREISEYSLMFLCGMFDAYMDTLTRYSKSVVNVFCGGKHLTVVNLL